MEYLEICITVAVFVFPFSSFYHPFACTSSKFILFSLTLSSINKYASCSPECFVLALVYIDRLIQRNHLALTSLNVHRVIITALMMASKFFDDQYFNNAYYAKVGGVPCTEINSLELEFLFSINFSLHVSTDVFEKYFAELASHMGMNIDTGEILGNNNNNSSSSSSNNTCDCMKQAQSLKFTFEEIRYSGMKTPDYLLGDIPSSVLSSSSSPSSSSSSSNVKSSSSSSSSSTSTRQTTSNDETMH